jgi:hypothetical protein
MTIECFCFLKACLADLFNQFQGSKYFLKVGGPSGPLEVKVEGPTRKQGALSVCHYYYDLNRSQLFVATRFHKIN